LILKETTASVQYHLHLHASPPPLPHLHTSRFMYVSAIAHNGKAKVVSGAVRSVNQRIPPVSMPRSAPEFRIKPLPVIDCAVIYISFNITVWLQCDDCSLVAKFLGIRLQFD
jgi:hypothetical protein